MTSDTTAAALARVAGRAEREVRPPRYTRKRFAALQALALGEITHPSAGIAYALEKANAVRWDRAENTYRVTPTGAQLLREWSASVDLGCLTA